MVEVTETHVVKTDAFEGPLELLLDLVEKRKLLINDISLAEVTDEYMAKVSAMQEASLPNTAQFVALAATLLLIKSRSLLPVLEFTEAEEESMENLEKRLKRYAFYKALSENIETAFGKTVLHERQYVPDRNPLFVTDDFTTTDKLHEGIVSVLEHLPRKEVKPKVQVKKVVSLDEMIDRLHKRITDQMKLRFSDLIKEEPEKHNVIVGFLAVLESVKQGSVLVAQAERFEDIHIEVEQAGAPRYL